MTVVAGRIVHGAPGAPRRERGRRNRGGAALSSFALRFAVALVPRARGSAGCDSRQGRGSRTCRPRRTTRTPRAAPAWSRRRSSPAACAIPASSPPCARSRATSSWIPRSAPSAYEDHPLPIGGSQTISQPYIVALMTELLALPPKARVLEIGTGSGYQSAVLAELAAEVYSIEIVPELARAAGAKLKRARLYERHRARGRRLPRLARARPLRRHHRHGRARADPPAARRSARPGRAHGHSGRRLLPGAQGLHHASPTARVSEKAIIPVRFVPMTGEIEKEKTPEPE